MIKTLFLMGFLCLIPLTAPLYAADCPPNVDPSYCAVANATGGKVYSGTPDETFKNFKEDIQGELDQKHRDMVISTTKHDIINILQGILYFLPALLPLIVLTIIRRKIEHPKLFATLYTIGNIIPSFCLFAYILIDTAGSKANADSLIFSGFLIFSGLIAVISFPMGYYRKDEAVPLYIVAILSAFLAYLPILALLSVTIS